MSIKQILVLPHLKVNNANAWSSPFTSGFPSVCSFGGAIHTLQRQLNHIGFNSIEISDFGVISHRFIERTYQEGKYGDSSIIAGANPLNKDGERQSFVPEIKCFIEISMVCEIKGISANNKETVEHTVMNIINGNIRIASGDILQTGKPYIIDVGTEEYDENFKRYIIRKLMPGYALIERRELMIESMTQGKDAMDALLDHVSVWNEPYMDNGRIEVKHNRKTNGWLVPISTGYGAVSEIAKAVNQRDADTPHLFAESLVTLGEFKMLHRLKGINALLWHANYDEKAGIYCYCQQTDDSCSDNDDSEFNFV